MSPQAQHGSVAQDSSKPARHRRMSTRHSHAKHHRHHDRPRATRPPTCTSASDMPNAGGELEMVLESLGSLFLFAQTRKGKG